MTEYTGSYYSVNENIRPIELFRPELFESGLVIYEVLRMQDGKALFIEDHVMRFQQSVLLSGHSYIFRLDELKERLKDLAAKNSISTGNVKIIALFQSGLPDIYSFFIPHSYPTPEMYGVGVEAALFRAERPDPNIKKLHPEIIRKISDFIKNQGIYDALLVDESGCITEGSRTNVFFISNRQVYTSPGDRVLKGITREKVFALCEELDISLIEKPILQSDIQEANAAFFSGTSPKILPIRSIGHLNFDVSDPILRKLMNAYNDLIRENLKAG